jgi:hypothetical protein
MAIYSPKYGTISEPVCLSGYLPAAAATYRSIWPIAATTGVVQINATAQTSFVSAANAADTVAGTGARSVTVIGLNGSYQRVRETVNTNGQTASPLTNTYCAIEKAQVIASGSNHSAVGLVYVGNGGPTTGVPTNPMAVIAANESVSSGIHGGVAVGEKFCITGYDISIYQGTANDYIFTLTCLDIPTVTQWYPFHEHATPTTYNSRRFDIPIEIPEKTIFRLDVVSTSGTLACRARLFGFYTLA